jgi:hypothetical protein
MAKEECGSMEQGNRGKSERMGGMGQGRMERGSGEQGKRGEAEGCGCCQPADEQIAARAYEIWLAGGATHGHDIEDWLLAECELRRARRRQRHGMAA